MGATSVRGDSGAGANADHPNSEPDDHAQRRLCTTGTFGPPCSSAKAAQAGQASDRDGPSSMAVRGHSGCAATREKPPAPSSAEPRPAKMSARSGMALLVLEGADQGRAWMLDRDETAAQLRQEFWDLQFKAPRPRAVEVVEGDQRRIAEIEAALAMLGGDVGPRPRDMPPHAA